MLLLADPPAPVSGIPPAPAPANQVNWFQFAGSYRSTGNAMAVDDEGNIYITGNFEEWINFHGEKIQTRGNGFRDPDFFVAKYNPFGQLLWLDHGGGKKDDAGLSIAVSGDNVYVTGYFGDTARIGSEVIYTTDLQNMFLANYSRDGELKWVRQAQSDGVLRGQALTTDNDGNVYVIGNFRDQVTFDSFTIKKSMEKNFYFVKYDSCGNVQWLKKGSGGKDFYTYIYAYDIASDGENIYISGEVSGPARIGHINYSTSFAVYKEGRLSRREIFIAKFNKKGEISWIKDAGTEARFKDMTVDKSGNVVITGYFEGAVNGILEGRAVFGNEVIYSSLDDKGKFSEDFFISSFSPKGKLNWVINGGNKDSDRGISVFADQKGDIYWTGFYTGEVRVGDIQLGSFSPEKQEIFVAKIGEKGQVKWARNINSTKGNVSKAIVADKNGNIYITGSFQGGIKVEEQWFLSAGYENFFVASLEDE